MMIQAVTANILVVPRSPADPDFTYSHACSFSFRTRPASGPAPRWEEFRSESGVNATFSCLSFLGQDLVHSGPGTLSLACSLSLPSLPFPYPLFLLLLLSIFTNPASSFHPALPCFSTGASRSQLGGPQSSS
eukprot:1307105-Rhodomonas_salina.9